MDDIIGIQIGKFENGSRGVIEISSGKTNLNTWDIFNLIDILFEGLDTTQQKNLILYLNRHLTDGVKSKV